MSLAEPAAASTGAPMPGIFTLIPVSTADGHYTFSIELDAKEPYLDDHRPGGDPLFSTVMAIEAAVSGARHCVSSAAPASVTGVNVYKPYILTAKHRHAIDLHVVRTDDVAPAFRCSLSSTQGGGTVPHLDATVRFATTTAPTVTRPLPEVGPVVDGAQVYQLFFHGPSFQVIGAARYHDGTMLCRLNRNLPTAHRAAGTVSQMAPRLIEFALQSAGLLEIATTGRMKIPHAIGSIERHLPIDVDSPGTLFARASYGSSDELHIDVEILDTSGRVALSVEEYRTVVLPFDVSAHGVTALRAQLRGASIDF
jgi:hypothetical protein